MINYTLVIGNKNYSSWSMRAWLMLKATGVDFKEILIPLRQENTRREIERHSPSGKVPVLLVDGFPIWDSLAIGEYLAQQLPQEKLWPADSLVQAHARSISAEMHSGFTALRTKRSMNMKKRETPAPDAEVTQEVARIEHIWAEARTMATPGDFLFGAFTIADAMYAPVVSRFVTYGIKVSKDSQRYMDAVWNMPAFGEWYKAALEETWVW
jgi:glutathione S-transferase